MKTKHLICRDVKYGFLNSVLFFLRNIIAKSAKRCTALFNDGVKLIEISKKI